MSRNQEGNTTEEIQQPTVSNLQLQALLGDMRRMMRAELEPIHEKIDRLEGETTAGQPQNAPIRQPPRLVHLEEQWGDDEDVEEWKEMDEPTINRSRFKRGNGNREARMDRPRRDNDLGGIKVKIPSFQGKNDPEAYLEWEKRMETIFDYYNYSEIKKVKLAAIEFTDYAIVWWNQLLKERKRNLKRPVEACDEMKTIMRRHFVPSYYHRELYNKLQRLTQGSKSVDDYYKEMEVAMIRANVEEDREATIARFLHGLNREIADVVEMQHYVELTDMVHQAIKVEQQLKQRNFPRKGPSSALINSWRSSPKRDEFPSTKPKSESSKDTK